MSSRAPLLANLYVHSGRGFWVWWICMAGLSPSKVQFTIALSPGSARSSRRAVHRYSVSNWGESRRQHNASSLARSPHISLAARRWPASTSCAMQWTRIHSGFAPTKNTPQTHASVPSNALGVDANTPRRARSGRVRSSRLPRRNSWQAREGTERKGACSWATQQRGRAARTNGGQLLLVRSFGLFAYIAIIVDYFCINFSR